MKTTSFYDKFAAEFRAASSQSLIEKFNDSVGSGAWTSMRAVHDKALLDEMERRGIDMSAIRHGDFTSYVHKVILDEDKNKLVIDLRS
jgi:hypothetical protein